MKKGLLSLAATVALAIITFTSAHAQMSYWGGKSFGIDGVTSTSTTSVSSGNTASVVWFGDSTTNSTGWAILNYYRTTSTSGLCAYTGNIADVRMPKTATSPGFGLLATPYLGFGVNTVTFSEGRGSRKVSIFYTTTDTTVTNYTSAGSIPSNWIFVDSSSTTATKCASKTVTINNPNVTRIIFTNLSISDADLDSISVTSTSAILPVKFANVSASKINGFAKISWNIEFEVNAYNYVIERSIDGINFSSVGVIDAINLGKYSYVDMSASAANNYYRIKAVDKDGSFAYSSVVFTVSDSKVATVTVYPNPVINKQVNVQLSNLVTGSYNVEVYNNLGQAVLSKFIQLDGANTSLTLQLPSSVSAGLYRLSVSDGATKINKTISIQ